MAKKFTKKSTDDIEEPKKTVEEEVVSENSEDSENSTSAEASTDAKVLAGRSADKQKVSESDDSDDEEIVDPIQPHRTFNFRSKLGSFKSKKFIAVAAVLIAVVASGLFLYNQNRFGAAGTLTAGDSARLIEKVGRLIDLPNEEPILATVSDVTKLNDDFYRNAQNGDRVLVYKNSKMAILYRPGSDKIIKVGTVTIDEPKTASVSGKDVAGVSDVITQEEIKDSITPTPSVLRVAIYNGTKTAGLAKKTGDSLIEKYQNINIVNTGNASGEYTSNLVVDLSGENKPAAQKIADEINGTIGNLPSGEEKPSSDILIILGASN